VFDESKHPRRPDGKFGSGGGGGDDPAVPAILQGLFTADVYPQSDEVASAYQDVLTRGGVLEPGEKLNYNSITFRGPNDPGGVWRGFSLEIVDSHGRRVLKADRAIRTDDDGKLTVEHELLKVRRKYQGEGRATKLNAAMEDVYRANGVDHLTTHADIDVGGYTWARAGWDFDPEMEGQNGTYMNMLFDAVIRNPRLLVSRPLSPAEFSTVRRWREAFTGPAEDWPTPLEISRFGWREGVETWPGKQMLLGSSWYGRRNL
jgi:hypothetical protein